jgi:hypothetical protein
MSELDELMQIHMASIVLTEHRPFSYFDFMQFEVEGCKYSMCHGTFRNKIAYLLKKNEVEVAYRSTQTFYTLKGHGFRKPMTPNHAVVHNHPFYEMLKTIPLGKQSIHDIRIRFFIDQIWKYMRLSNYPINSKSLDIYIPAWSIDNVILRTIIHKTNTVSIILSCSMDPIPLDVYGIIYFSNLLVRSEERLRSLFEKFSSNTIEPVTVPGYKKWIVTMWHFGRDALVEYDGEKFSITVEKAINILLRVYSKNFEGKHKIRFERQEYPKKTVGEIIDERLDCLQA